MSDDIVLSSSSLQTLVEQAEHWLQSNPDVPYDAATEAELDARHHSEAYDIIKALLASLLSPVEGRQGEETRSPVFDADGKIIGYMLG